MNEYEARKNAREDVAKAIKDHAHRQGKEISYREAYKKACERGDICDAKKDRRIKE